MAIEEIVDCPLIEGRRVLLRPLEVEDFDDWRDAVSYTHLTLPTKA